MKIIILIALLLIVGVLLLAGRAMVQGGHGDKDAKPKSNRMANALAWRVGLSVALFLFIWLSYHMGWIQPTGIAAGQ
jgi:preprotein translocase subunit SecG